MLNQKDKIIVDAIISRDEKVLYYFYTKNKKKLLSFVLRTIRDENDAQEIVQDTFLAFIEALRDFRFDSSLKTFLFAIAKRKTVDRIRKKRIKTILFSFLPERLILPISSFLLEEEMDKQFLSKKIETILGLIPNDYALILQLKYKDGYKVQEIAQKISLSIKATESLIYRARRSFIKAYVQHERQTFLPICK